MTFFNLTDSNKYSLIYNNFAKFVFQSEKNLVINTNIVKKWNFKMNQAKMEKIVKKKRNQFWTLQTNYFIRL